jgi:putative transposase
MKYGSTGHLWQARPFSCALDEEHFWAAIRYVERNPLRAGMVDCAEHYPWSSAATHCGLIADSMLDFESVSSVQIEDWHRWLTTGNPVEFEERIRQSTFTGRPCGNESFVRESERRLGRHLTPQKPGRKPKAAVAENRLWTTDEIRP